MSTLVFIAGGWALLLVLVAPLLLAICRASARFDAAEDRLHAADSVRADAIVVGRRAGTAGAGHAPAGASASRTRRPDRRPPLTTPPIGF